MATNSSMNRMAAASEPGALKIPSQLSWGRELQPAQNHPVSEAEAHEALAVAGVRVPSPGHIEAVRENYDAARELTPEDLGTKLVPTKKTLVAAAAKVAAETPGAARTPHSQRPAHEVVQPAGSPQSAETTAAREAAAPQPQQGTRKMIARIRTAIEGKEDIRLTLERIAEQTLGGTRAQGTYTKQDLYENAGSGDEFLVDR